MKTPPVLRLVLVASALASGCAHERGVAPQNPGELRVELYAELTGRVLDPVGKPVVGVKVSMVLRETTVPLAVSDESGTYVFRRIPIGYTQEGKTTLRESDVELVVEIDGVKIARVTTTLRQGANSAPTITLWPT